MGACRYSFFFFLFNDLCIQKGELTERSSICLLVHSANGRKSWVWAKLMPGARGFFEVSHAGPQGAGARAVLHCLSITSAGGVIQHNATFSINFPTFFKFKINSFLLKKKIHLFLLERQINKERRDRKIFRLPFYSPSGHSVRS